MAQRDVDLKSEEDVKEYLERLGIEYRFGCYYEKDGKGNFQLIYPHSTIALFILYSSTINKNPYFSFQACDLLGNFMEQINQDYHKAFKIYQTACDEYKFGHSCQRVGSYLFAGKSVERDVVRYQTNRSYSIRQS